MYSHTARIPDFASPPLILHHTCLTVTGYRRVCHPQMKRLAFERFAEEVRQVKKGELHEHCLAM